MAAEKIACKQTDTSQVSQKGRDEDGKITEAPRFSSPIRQFPSVKHNIKAGLSSSPLHDGSSASEGSFSHRRHSVASPVAARPFDVGSRRFSHHTASSTNRMAANDMLAHHKLSQQNSQLCRRPQTARFSHPMQSEDKSASSDRNSTASLQQVTLPSPKANCRSSSQKATIKAPVPTSARTVASPSHRLQTKSLSSRPPRTSSETGPLSVASQINLEKRTNAKDPAGNTKRPAELLCKECKTSAMAPVCFINNDGKVAAAVTHRFHHCKSPGCAANRNSSQSIPKSHSLHRIERQPAKNESNHSLENELNDFAKLGVSCRSVCSNSSSIGESDNHEKFQVANQMNDTSMKARSENGEVRENCNLHSSNDFSHYDQTQLYDADASYGGKVGLDGLPESENIRCLSSSRNEGNHQSGVDDKNHAVESSIPAAISCITSDIIYPHEGDDNGNPQSIEQDAIDELKDLDSHGYHQSGENGKNSGVESSIPSATSHTRSDSLHPHERDDNSTPRSVEQDGIDELKDLKSYCYQGDNEYSCSEDGTDAATAPPSSKKDAFDYLSTQDGEKPLGSTLQRPTRSSMARIRQKYLDLLRKQEAETVRLRKQEIMARKQAGDWMLDCHMEDLVHKLAPNGEARVKDIVEAFETVIHHSDSESSQTHHQENGQMHSEQEELQLESIHSDISV